MAEISFDDFMAVDVRVGTVVQAEPYPEARKPAIKIWVDFGGQIGVKKTSAQVTVLRRWSADKSWLWSISRRARLVNLCLRFWSWAFLMKTGPSFWLPQINLCPKEGDCIEKTVDYPRYTRSNR